MNVFNNFEFKSLLGPYKYVFVVVVMNLVHMTNLFQLRYLVAYVFFSDYTDNIQIHKNDHVCIFCTREVSAYLISESNLGIHLVQCTFKHTLNLFVNFNHII